LLFHTPSMSSEVESRRNTNGDSNLSNSKSTSQAATTTETASEASRTIVARSAANTSQALSSTTKETDGETSSGIEATPSSHKEGHEAEGKSSELPALGQNPRLRRSSRRNNRTDQDPIIAPGFGTIKDIHRLASQLSEGNEITLTPEAVIAMMNSRGEGIRRSSRSSSANPPVDASSEEGGAAAVPSAWASFMKEESTAAGGEKQDGNDAESTRKRPPQTATGSSDGGKKKKSAATDEGDDLHKQHCGVLVQTGTLNTAVVGRGKVKLENPPSYNLFEPTKLLSPKIAIRTVHTSSNSCHSIAISKEGVVYGWGRNEFNQLASNLPDNVVLPTILTDFPKNSTVISAATGKSHTLVLMDDGSVYAIGVNKSGQCGVKANIESITNFRKCVFQHEGEVISDIRIKQVSFI
jgi:Regulator of chromosome condensation (RCC1) repeat